eukprot:2826771-Karenia_brevis.AAC.1
MPCGKAANWKITCHSVLNIALILRLCHITPLFNSLRPNLDLHRHLQTHLHGEPAPALIPAHALVLAPTP